MAKINYRIWEKLSEKQKEKIFSRSEINISEIRETVEKIIESTDEIGGCIILIRIVPGTLISFHAAAEHLSVVFCPLVGIAQDSVGTAYFLKEIFCLGVSGIEVGMIAHSQIMISFLYLLLCCAPVHSQNLVQIFHDILPTI